MEREGFSRAVLPDPSHVESDATRTGLSPRTAAVLAYAAWWISGGLFLLLEPTHPYVRFHARQSFVGFGLIWLAGFLLWGLSFASVFVSVTVFRVSAVLAQVVWGAGCVLWVVCVVQAWRGRRWALPGLGGGRT
jgi:uncharacterized membrane protein